MCVTFCQSSLFLSISSILAPFKQLFLFLFFGLLYIHNKIGVQILKKLILFIISAILIASAIIPVSTALASDGYFEEATVIAEDVNLRLRPTTDSPTVTVLEKGTRIGVYCEEQPGWYRVIFGNYRGYVSSEFIFLSSTDTMIGHVIEDGLNMRQHANEYSTVVCDLDVGTAVTITNIIGDWYYASTDEYEGYISSEYIELSTTKSTSSLLKPGMDGVSVADMQRELYSRGFFAGPITGYYGDVTLAAVQAFQKEAGISEDGIVGETTLELLYGDNDIKTNAAKLAGIEGQVQLSTWDEINEIWEKGTTALVTDVETGLQYTTYRFGGWYHADCEPLTAEDTAIMNEIYGGTWSWDRRAIWVTINGVTYAASQNGMPHLASPVSGNDFDGHYCIHFYHSKVHETSAECPRHQACVLYAYEQAQ